MEFFFFTILYVRVLCWIGCLSPTCSYSYFVHKLYTIYQSLLLLSLFLFRSEEKMPQRTQENMRWRLSHQIELRKPQKERKREKTNNKTASCFHIRTRTRFPSITVAQRLLNVHWDSMESTY